MKYILALLLLTIHLFTSIGTFNYALAQDETYNSDLNIVTGTLNLACYTLVLTGNLVVPEETSTIDINDVNLVINLESPTSTTSYSNGLFINGTNHYVYIDNTLIELFFLSSHV